MRYVILVFILLITNLLSACEIAMLDTGAVAKSDMARDTAPEIPVSDARMLLEDNNAFAFDFYRQVRMEPGNLIYSPYSITLAAAMLYGGAGGETAAQMARTLHFTLLPDQLHPALNALELELAQRLDESKKIDSKNPMQLYIANAVWAQRDYPFEKGYLDLLAVNYGAGLRLLDFSAEPEDACQQINGWINKSTKGKIKDILSPDSLDPKTRLLLANAIYFKASWQDAFVKNLTGDVTFTLLDGSQVLVPTMQTDGEIPLRISAGEGYQAVALPYKGSLAEMVIILPDQGKFEVVESALDAANFATILQTLEPGSLKVYMPKFEFTGDIALKPVLSALGMPLAFDEMQADFSNITKAEQLFVQQAMHKAYILVNEEGTEAAAVTLFLVAPASLPMELHIDRPFIFVIRDVPTGTILFVGRVLDPLGQ